MGPLWRMKSQCTTAKDGVGPAGSTLARCSPTWSPSATGEGEPSVNKHGNMPHSPPTGEAHATHLTIRNLEEDSLGVCTTDFADVDWLGYDRYGFNYPFQLE